MEPDGSRAAAWPLVLNGCAAWLHDAPGDVGVVLCSPWGFEELCLRRSWRMLADQLAAAGYPTLRFDYPGCGDSLGDAEGSANLAAFVEAATTAADALRVRGARQMVMLGQGMGAVVAALAAPAAQADAAILLAPPARGRDHLRELSVWGAMVAETMHLATEPGPPGTVAGFEMPERLRVGLSAVNLVDLERPPTPLALVAARTARPGDVRVLERLKSLSVNAALIEYQDYEAVLGNPTSARPPLPTMEKIVGWLRAHLPPQKRRRRAAPREPAAMTGPWFIETPVRVGSLGLHAVLCEPLVARRGAGVLMLNAGGDPHTGWARCGVEHARSLAAAGVASLRLDGWDVGDSPGPVTDQPSRFYNLRTIQDALDAAAWMQARGLGPVLTVGRCSSAYAAFNAALASDAMGELILVNQRRFIWDGDGEVEAASDQLGHYQRQARNPLKLLARWIRGELDLEAALARLTPAAVSLVRGLLSGHRRKIARDAHDALRRLEARGVRLNYLYSRGGEAHADLEGSLGAAGKGLRRYRNVSLRWLDGADHALTPAFARDALLALMRDRALSMTSTVVGAQITAAGPEDFAAGALFSGGPLPA